jgi:beta-barrel assembly-enhancing protease
MKLFLNSFPIIAAVILIASSYTAVANEDLPSLGNASSRLVSIDQERKLGSAWLRSLRGQVRAYDNPIIEDYLTQLVYSLAPNSAVIDRDFRFVILDSPQLNAFAVPGSVIGVNSGLFLYAATEQEFASVIAHELAHLSQRHYARRLEKQQLSTPLTLAGVLASVVLAATTGSDAGIAALASTQALSVEKQLGYSRQNEQEADRIGIDTLYRSDYDPRAMPAMFERMLKASRLQGNAMPEYLSTHPLSENRVSDTRNRADQYEPRQYIDTIEYHLAKNLIAADYSENPQAAAKYFEAIIAKGNTIQSDGAKFGLAYALLNDNPEKSLNILTSLSAKYPAHLSLEVVLADALYKSGEKARATEHLENLLKRNPNNYPTSIALAEIYQSEQNFQAAEDILVQLARERKENPLIWYMLAEVHGQAGNIAAVHHARGQYFMLTNQLNYAIEQLNLGIKKAKPNSRQATLLRQLLDDVYEMKENPVF